MKTISIELPATVFSALRQTPDEFVQEMRIAAAVKWYELGQISQGFCLRNSRINSDRIY